MVVYVFVAYMMPDAKQDGSMAVLGVFDNKGLAEQYREEFTKADGEDIVFYEILEYQINTIEDPEEEDLSEDLRELVKKEIIDYTVGEDGEFYFHLTEKGKEIVRGKRNMED